MIDIREEDYLRFTDYHHFPGGRKRLQVITRFCRKRSEQLQRPLRVLDVGCGNGSNSLPVASLGHTLLGIDISQESINYVSGRNPFTNARFRKHNLLEESLEERFDLLICSEVLEHLHNPELLVRAMVEVLDLGGLLVITIPNGYGPREVLGRLEIRLRKSSLLMPALEKFRSLLGMSSAAEKCRMHTSNPDQDHVQKFTPGQIKGLMESNGLRLVEWVNSFWLLSLFGKAKEGTNRMARLDSWLAETAPAYCSSGWFIVCEKVKGDKINNPR